MKFLARREYFLLVDCFLAEPAVLVCLAVVIGDVHVADAVPQFSNAECEDLFLCVQVAGVEDVAGLKDAP